MNYTTFSPHADLASFVKCYWELEVAADPDVQKQRIIPDGYIEMFFILGDDVRRFTTETDYILQPRAMVLGQITEPFYIQPSGYVHSFAIRFYPYGFAHFVHVPLKELANKETPLETLFPEGTVLQEKVESAGSTPERIAVMENYLLGRLTEKSTIDKVVKNTVDTLLGTKGNARIGTILERNGINRRQLERKFFQQVGLSPKQLGKVIRLQYALQRLLNREKGNLTEIAYDSDYYDQAHFTRDFREFTGISPKDFPDDAGMELSSRLYTD
ncbi:MAG: helix-turn-helix domain-containing protein [Leadbetterella sp.]|nr:helix-turn-helix domain-containing protein [Leadbetterella sp.]